MSSGGCVYISPMDTSDERKVPRKPGSLRGRRANDDDGREFIFSDR